MNIDWFFVSLFVLVPLGNAADYWFAPPEKKRDVGAQVLTSSLAWLGSTCVLFYWAEKLSVWEPSSWTIWVAMLLSVGVVYLSIGGAVWWLLHKFVLKR